MPDDNNTTPLINTIRETTIAAIAKKYNIEAAQKRFDISHSQSDSEYITGAIGEYNDTIQDIIDNIPDVPPTPPVPTLPTIEKIQSKYGSIAPSITFDPGVKADLYYSSNSNLITYDSAKVYIYRGKIVNDSGEWDARLTYQLYAYNNNGVVAVENISSDWGVSAEGWLFSCDDPSVDVIYVKRTADSKLFWAFKKTVDGTDYYFVLSQSDWTDNLSSIGFETSSVQPDLPVKLPSVTTINVSLSALGLSKSLANDEPSALYNSSSGYSQVLYDASKVYATVYMSASTIWHSGFPLENGYGVVTVRNKTGSTMTIYGGIIAQCDNASASVVTVYNSSNTVYNAFKYTVDGTDYYYVLDETQADWTDDLSSIGYHLPAILYLNSSSAKTDTYMSYMSPYYLYRNGSQVVYSSSLILKNVYNAVGTVSTARFSLTVINGVLALRCDSGSANVCYCEILGL